MADPPKVRPAAPPPAPPKLERAPVPGAAPAASRGLAAREVDAAAAIAAGLAQQGELAEASALRLFALCAATGATGRLTLSPDGADYTLAFRKGGLEHVASTRREDELPAFLVSRGVVRAEQVEAAARDAGDGGDVVAALVTARQVNGADLVRFIQEHAAQLALRALGVEAGRWSWAPGVAPPPGSFPIGSPWMTLGAAVRALDPAAVSRRLGPREQLGASRMSGRVRIEDLRLTSHEARAASFFDGRRLSDVARAQPGEATTILRVALLLAEVDLLTFGAPTAAAPSAEAPAPPPSVPPVAPPTAPPEPSRAPRPAPAPAARPVAAPSAARPPAPAAAAPRTSTPPPAPPALDARELKARLDGFAQADHFKVLGVPQDASAAQIKNAYFQLARTFHPDTVQAETSPEVKKLCADLFSRIGEAWGVIGDDTRRAQYLDDLKTGAAEKVDVSSYFKAEEIFLNATLLVKSRRYEEALVQLKEAVRLDAETAEYGMWICWCQFLMAADKKSVQARLAGAIEAALKKAPNCVPGYLFLGQMAKVVGDLALAEKQLRRGLAVAPSNPELQRELKYLRK